MIGDYRSNIDLLYVKQGIYFGRIYLLPEVEGIISRIEQLAEQNNFPEGKALALVLIWQVEKLKQNFDEAIEAREKVMEIMTSLPTPSRMNYYTVLFSYAYWVFAEDGDFITTDRGPVPEHIDEDLEKLR